MWNCGIRERVGIRILHMLKYCLGTCKKTIRYKCVHNIMVNGDKGAIMNNAFSFLIT